MLKKQTDIVERLDKVYEFNKTDGVKKLTT